MAGIKVIRPDERDRGTAQTSGMVREAGISRETVGAAAAAPSGTAYRIRTALCPST